MKLIVSTFLVYKVKKCLLKSGKVRPRLGDTMPKAWATLLNAVSYCGLDLDNVWIYPFLAFIYTIYGL